MEYWYKYRDDLWKRVIMGEYQDSGSYRPRKPEPDEKLKSNIRRAARMIESYALCNDWDWFGTFTLDKRFHDRKDLDGFRREFVVMIRSLRRTRGNIEYLLVPELHKNKDGWHMHGMLKGIPESDLRPFTLEEKLPKYIRDKLKGGSIIYDWERYRQSFGFVDLEHIKNRDAASRYISKYITKATEESTAKSIKAGNHLYYASRGLSLPELVEKEKNSGAVPESFPIGLTKGNSYEFEYGAVEWYQRP